MWLLPKKVALPRTITPPPDRPSVIRSEQSLRSNIRILVSLHVLAIFHRFDFDSIAWTAIYFSLLPLGTWAKSQQIELQDSLYHCIYCKAKPSHTQSSPQWLSASEAELWEVVDCTWPLEQLALITRYGAACRTESFTISFVSLYSARFFDQHCRVGIAHLFHLPIAMGLTHTYTFPTQIYLF